MKSIYQSVVALEISRNSGALCMIVRSKGSTPRHSASKMLVYADGKIEGSIGGGELERRIVEEALSSIHDRKPRFLGFNMTDPSKGDVGICGGQVEVYVEPILPPDPLVIIGGGHVGKAVAHLAKWLGFHIIISDDRAELCTPQSNPDADSFLICPIEELPNRLEITSRTLFVFTTRGNEVDIKGLSGILESPASYIGVIGSKRRWSETRKALVGAGVSPSKLKKVHSPIGIELGAETPEEIAVSIMAEILSIKNKKY